MGGLKSQAERVGESEERREARDGNVLRSVAWGFDALLLLLPICGIQRSRRETRQQTAETRTRTRTQPDAYARRRRKTQTQTQAHRATRIVQPQPVSRILHPPSSPHLCVPSLSPRERLHNAAWCIVSLHVREADFHKKTSHASEKIPPK